MDQPAPDGGQNGSGDDQELSEWQQNPRVEGDEESDKDGEEDGEWKNTPLEELVEDLFESGVHVVVDAVGPFPRVLSLVLSEDVLEREVEIGGEIVAVTIDKVDSHALITIL